MRWEGDPSSRAGQFCLGRLLQRFGRLPVRRPGVAVAAPADGIGGAVVGGAGLGLRPVAVQRTEGSPTLGGPRGCVVRHHPVVEQNEVGERLQGQDRLVLLALGEDLDCQI